MTGKSIKLNLSNLPPEALQLDERTMQMIRNAVVANVALAALPGVLSPEYLCRRDGHRIVEDGDAYDCLTCGKRFTLIE